MKSCSKLLFVLLLCFTSAVSFSQVTKPRIFSQFPETIDCSVTQFITAFSSKEGETVTFSFSDNLKITGKVLSNVQKYYNLQSMTVQVPGYLNAVFHLSKQTNQDNSISYVGRILSTGSQDGYEIRKGAAGNYTLKKIEENRIRQICSL